MYMVWAGGGCIPLIPSPGSVLGRRKGEGSATGGRVDPKQELLRLIDPDNFAIVLGCLENVHSNKLTHQSLKNSRGKPSINPSGDPTSHSHH